MCFLVAFFVVLALCLAPHWWEAFALFGLVFVLLWVCEQWERAEHAEKMRRSFNEDLKK